MYGGHCCPPANTILSLSLYIFFNSVQRTNILNSQVKQTIQFTNFTEVTFTLGFGGDCAVELNFLLKCVC